MEALGIRDGIREAIVKARNEKRNKDMDSMRFGLDDQHVSTTFSHITDKDVAGIAMRIKRRKKADIDDLEKLSCAFLANESNISCFCKIAGALNIIVKELTGLDAATQILASEALCNLSLGNEVCCEKISTNCGSYLAMFLTSSNLRLLVNHHKDLVWQFFGNFNLFLQRTTVWTITNLMACDPKSRDFFINQEIVSKLCTQVNIRHQDDDLYEDCMIAIDVLVSAGWEALRQTDKDCLLTTWLSGARRNDYFYMKVLYKISTAFPMDVLPKLARIATYILIESAQDFIDFTVARNVLSICFCVRVLGNCVAAGNLDYTEFLSNFNPVLKDLSEFFNQFFRQNNSYVNKELLWCVGNIYNCKDDAVITYLKCDNLKDNLKVMKCM